MLELVEIVEVVDVVVVVQGPGTHMFVGSVLESGVPALFEVNTARVYEPGGTLMKHPGMPIETLQAA